MLHLLRDIDRNPFRSFNLALTRLLLLRRKAPRLCIFDAGALKSDLAAHGLVCGCRSARPFETAAHSGQRDLDRIAAGCRIRRVLRLIGGFARLG